MAYEQQARWSLFRFAVRNSCVAAAILTAVVFIVAALLRSLTPNPSPISLLWAVTWVAGFYLFALSLLVLRWYAYLARTKREARKRGWGD